MLIQHLLDFYGIHPAGLQFGKYLDELPLFQGSQGFLWIPRRQRADFLHDHHGIRADAPALIFLDSAAAGVVG
jgi:hypothetical protein